jgi:hypothetical protein
MPVVNETIDFALFFEYVCGGLLKLQKVSIYPDIMINWPPGTPLLSL